MATIKLEPLQLVPEWPRRKLPQDRYDETVKAAMDKLHLMTDQLNTKFIPKVNELNLDMDTQLKAAQSAASQAETARNAAQASQTAAKTSETNAANSASSARTSELAAAGSMNTASQAAQTALTARNSAQASATNAMASEGAALQSANDAAASERNVQTMEASVRTNTSKAQTAATNATTSATNAANSAREANASAAAAQSLADQIFAQNESVAERLDEASELVETAESYVASTQTNAQTAKEAAELADEKAQEAANNVGKIQGYAELAVTAQKTADAERARVEELATEIDGNLTEHERIINAIADRVNISENNVTAKADETEENARQAKAAADLAVVAQKDCVAEREYIDTIKNNENEKLREIISDILSEQSFGATLANYQTQLIKLTDRIAALELVKAQEG